jgi:hypothetical protein
VRSARAISIREIPFAETHQQQSTIIPQKPHDRLRDDSFQAWNTRWPLIIKRVTLNEIRIRTYLMYVRIRKCMRENSYFSDALSSSLFALLLRDAIAFTFANA